MDLLTHSFSGAALLLAMPRRPAAAWALPLSMAVAILPDIDIVFPSTPIDSLLLHRGITHALPALPIFAPLCALIMMYPFWRRGTPGAWTFRQTAFFAFLLLLMHIWLDCVTSYGTLAFLPFSDYRVRLNGLFIVDLWLLIPLILACCAARRRFRIAALAMTWLIFYTGGAVAWRIHLEDKWSKTLQADGIAATQLGVLPDAFSPLHWKVKYEHDGHLFQASLDWKGHQTSPWIERQSADPALLNRLSSEDRSIGIWRSFSFMPLQEEQDWEEGKEYTFYDWRFSSLVPFAQTIQDRRRNDTNPFRLIARLDGTDRLVAVRYIGSTRRRDAGWQPPAPSKGRRGIYWLIGLDE